IITEESPPDRTSGGQTPLRRPRIALVRGRFLNLWEAQNFAPLDDRFEIVGITSQRPDYSLSDLPFSHQELFAPAQRIAGNGLAARIARRAVARTTDDNTLRGLSATLRDFDLIHSAETHLGFSAQAALARNRYHIPLVLTCWENTPFAYY